MFGLTYKFFLYLNSSQILYIILALINKADLKTILKIPSIFILFNSIFTDSKDVGVALLSEKALHTALEANKLTHPDNNLDSFFWSIILLAIIQRFLNNFFKIL
jgi:hypothetical protein